MTHKSIKEIIRTYLQNDVPEQVRESFEKWMLDTESFQEKNEALESIWNESVHESSGDGGPVRTVSSVFDDASAFDAARKRSDRRRGTALWISSAAAVFFAFIALFQFFSDRTPDVRLASSEDAKASFVLPDGSKVWLNGGSTLSYSKGLKGRKRTVTLEGEGFFDVEKNPDRPFVVKARDLDITVLGTEFTVSAQDDKDIAVYLQEGRVKVSGPKLEDGLEMKPDQAIIYDRLSSGYKVRKVKAANHTAWIRDRLDFYNTSLYDILETLCQWYNTGIKCTDPVLAGKIKLTLTVRQEPLEEIMLAIAELVPYEFTTSKDSMDTVYITLSKH